MGRTFEQELDKLCLRVDESCSLPLYSLNLDYRSPSTSLKFNVLKPLSEEFTRHYRESEVTSSRRSNVQELPCTTSRLTYLCMFLLSSSLLDCSTDAASHSDYAVTNLSVSLESYDKLLLDKLSLKWSSIIGRLCPDMLRKLDQRLRRYVWRFELERVSQ